MGKLIIILYALHTGRTQFVLCIDLGEGTLWKKKIFSLIKTLKIQRGKEKRNILLWVGK